ncbi:MAG TPA: hypothetical protein VH593_09760, partial [Ktedonobacteraceae bacterium]
MRSLFRRNGDIVSQPRYAYAELRRRNIWRENSLASADEDENLSFHWQHIRLFIPYLQRYRWRALISIVLMLAYTALNLANPYLIGVMIDSFIVHADLVGLAWMSVLLLGVNVAMWQAQYWQVWTMSWTGQQMLYLISS